MKTEKYFPQRNSKKVARNGQIYLQQPYKYAVGVQGSEKQIQEIRNKNNMVGSMKKNMLVQQ